MVFYYYHLLVYQLNFYKNWPVSFRSIDRI